MTGELERSFTTNVLAGRGQQIWPAFAVGRRIAFIL
jgi:hypothetical protein